MTAFRLPGYSLPKRQSWHWFILRRSPGDWFAAATGSLFNTLPDRQRDPGARLVMAIRRERK